VKAPWRRSATGILILLLLFAAVMTADLLFALLSCASTAPPQEDTNALTVQKQTSATTGSGISNLKEQAQKGDRIAQYNLASLYMHGSTVPQDYGEAAKWYLGAATQGLAAAQFGVGYLYEQGKGVAKDYGQAVRYYRAAADQGNAMA
jgi:TPR repeat protein